MASKDFIINEDIGITVYKRKTSRNLRLSIAASGKVRVTIPSWAPYVAGLNFAKSRQDWISDQLISPAPLTNFQAIGKAHHLEFVADSAAAKARSRIKSSTIFVYYPLGDSIDSSKVQKIAEEGCVRALRLQAEKLLPQRLKTLAETHGFVYVDVSVKRLKGRWGSCDSETNIILNLFLMQLPWELIDYVLMHELTHTKILRHGPDFWRAMKELNPDTPRLRKAVSQHKPILRSISQPQPVT